MDNITEHKRLYSKKSERALIILKNKYLTEYNLLTGTISSKKYKIKKNHKREYEQLFTDVKYGRIQ